MDDPYLRLRGWATPGDEICSCGDRPPIKLMWALEPNPIHCLDCNLEVEPASLPLPEALVDAVADWAFVAGAVNALELDSGAYEAWARRELLDAGSSVNKQGLTLRHTLDRIRRCYLWLFQPQSDEGYDPPEACPACSGALSSYDSGIFPQLLCERCGVVLAG